MSGGLVVRHLLSGRIVAVLGPDGAWLTPTETNVPGVGVRAGDFEGIVGVKEEADGSLPCVARCSIGREHTPGFDRRVSRVHLELSFDSEGHEHPTLKALARGSNRVVYYADGVQSSSAAASAERVLRPADEFSLLPTKEALERLSSPQLERNARSSGLFDYRVDRAPLFSSAYAGETPGKRAADAGDLANPALAKRPRLAGPFAASLAAQNTGLGQMAVKWTIVQEGSFYAYLNEAHEPCRDIVAFDVDSTLVRPRSNSSFARSSDDWQWLYADVKSRLSDLSRGGSAIVLVTNQAGVARNNPRLEVVQARLANIVREAPFVTAVLMATKKDHFRKPSELMWRWWQRNHNAGVEPSENSLFVGDAAGRPGDHAVADRAFAHNIGLPFKTPEQFFGKPERSSRWDWKSFDAHAFLQQCSPTSPLTVPLTAASDTCELVLLVGSPASGKSSLARRSFSKYVWVNQDTLKTRKRCTQEAERALRSGRSVVVDNTNPSADVRKEYVDIARSLGVPVSCVMVDASPDLCAHLNLLRERATHGQTPRLPRAAFTSYTSRLVRPSEAEGFEKVVIVPWAPAFESDEARRLFLQRLCD